MTHNRQLVYLLCILFVIVSSRSVDAQTTYTTVRVGYRELQLSPEDFSSVLTDYEPFRTDTSIDSLLASNDTLFWEPLGHIDPNYDYNASINTVGFIQINTTGFYQTLIGLDSLNSSILWISLLDNTVSSNFTYIVEAATDFFANDNRYWGVCEEIVVVPGSLIQEEIHYVWRFTFRLIAEGERWTLLFDSSGNLLNQALEDIPCSSCNQTTPFVILGVTGAIVTIVMVLYTVNKKRATQ